MSGYFAVFVMPRVKEWFHRVILVMTDTRRSEILSDQIPISKEKVLRNRGAVKLDCADLP